VRDYWEKEPLVIHRNDRDYFAGLFSISDIDSYLHLSRFDQEPGAILLANSKKPPLLDKIYGRSGFPETHLVMNSYQEGDSIVLNRAQRYWLPLSEMCREWESIFRCLVSLSIYLTPANAQGFPPHFEGHEVCAMQLHGSKTWKIYPPEIISPLHSREVKRSEITAPPKEITLHAGDFLYLPRGCIHEGVSAAESSLHLSALIRSYTWFDLISAAFENASRKHEILRRSLTPGTLLEKNSAENSANTFHEILANLPDWLEAAPGWKSIEKKFLMEQQPLPDSRFESLLQLDSISLETRVTRHEGTLCSVSSDSQSAEITFCRNFMKGPLSTLSAFEFIAENKTFLVKELPDNLSDDAKVTLIRRLVKEGLLGLNPLNT
jgi:hypothetical protein